MTSDVEYFGVSAQKRVERLTLAFGLTASLALLALRGWRDWPNAAGLGLGATAAWLNFRWLKQFVQWIARISMARPGEEKLQMPARVYWKMIGRYALLGAVLYAMLLRFYWPVLAFLCGWFTLVAAVLLEVIGELVYFARRGLHA